MHAKVTQTYGRAPTNWLVDGGYVSQDGIEAVAERGSRVHAPAGEAGQLRQPGDRRMAPADGERGG